MLDCCKRAPAGWRCSRAAGHDGPCAAHPQVAIDIDWDEDEITPVITEPYVMCPACPAWPGSGAARYEAVMVDPHAKFDMNKCYLFRKIPCTFCGGEGEIRRTSALEWARIQASGNGT